MNKQDNIIMWFSKGRLFFLKIILSSSFEVASYILFQEFIIFNRGGRTIVINLSDITEVTFNNYRQCQGNRQLHDEHDPIFGGKRIYCVCFFIWLIPFLVRIPDIGKVTKKGILL